MLGQMEKSLKATDKYFSRIGFASGPVYVRENMNKGELTEQLLGGYRDMKFYVDNKLGIVNSENEKKINHSLSLYDIEPTKSINEYCVELIDTVLEKLKEYPVYGEIYYEIVYYKYISKDIYTFKDIGIMLNTAKSNVLSKKNEALAIISGLLFGETPNQYALEYLKNI